MRYGPNHLSESWRFGVSGEMGTAADIIIDMISSIFGAWRQGYAREQIRSQKKEAAYQSGRAVVRAIYEEDNIAELCRQKKQSNQGILAAYIRLLREKGTSEQAMAKKVDELKAEMDASLTRFYRQKMQEGAARRGVSL